MVNLAARFNRIFLLQRNQVNDHLEIVQIHKHVSNFSKNWGTFLRIIGKTHMFFGRIINP
ncbi:MAG: hypothetical protein A2X25_05385 [Chloroflexi bacterium GWB2_49_20]|nr:MAG: hypothetical protein A2X25_05385 [Chloroflexi bacterium GWB2_49_20]OGN77059.1 MAG: hypothetical protein A2X26_06385 [Chloroflexi bacterium GWC2_49_37]OGN83785.1 MAG: hypothetical protein A2X27_01985 [Chloroflexi bacterium GWD2_49_16]